MSEPAHGNISTCSERGRIEGADLAKGLAMTYIVFTHTGLVSELRLLGGWGLPVFYMIPGMFYKKQVSFSRFIARNFIKLLCPGSLFMLLGLVIRMVALPEFSMQTLLAEMHHGIGHALDEIVRKSNAPLWFIFSLFFMECLWWIVDFWFERAWLKVITALAVAVTAMLLDRGSLFFSFLVFVLSLLVARPVTLLIRNIFLPIINKSVRYSSI